jgi:hypothetical protein
VFCIILCRVACTVFSPIFSLATHSVVISLRYRIFHPACPALLEGLFSAAFFFGCYSKFSFRFKTCFDFSYCAVGVLVLPGLRCFLCLVDLISGNAMELLHWVQCEHGAFLSVLVYTAYMCCVKVTLLHVCMLLLKKNILIIVLQSLALFGIHFEIYLQFDFIGWDAPSGQRFHRRCECCNTKK